MYLCHFQSCGLVAFLGVNNKSCNGGHYRCALRLERTRAHYTQESDAKTFQLLATCQSVQANTGIHQDKAKFDERTTSGCFFCNMLLQPARPSADYKYPQQAIQRVRITSRDAIDWSCPALRQYAPIC